MRVLALLPALLAVTACACAQGPVYMKVGPQPPPAGPTLAVRVQADGSARIGGAVADSAAVVRAVRQHVRAHPDGATAFSASGRAPYSDYIRMLDAVKEAYLAERDVYARWKFGAPYADLSDAGREATASAVPLRITLAEPD